MKTIYIDLAQAIKTIPTDIEAGKTGECRYTAPCVVGQMMSEDDRQALADADCDTHGISGLGHDPSLSQSFYPKDIEVKFANLDQLREAIDLQNHFDSGDTDSLRNTIAELKEKYK